jgi:hypothetical protein
MRARQNAAVPLLCLAVAACGGSSSSTTSELTGNLAFQAIAVSGYQAFRGQADAPYFALQLALPSTSPFLRSGHPGVSPHTASSAVAFQPELDLYFTGAQTSTSATISFFTDAAATQSAGSIQLTGLNGQALGQYASFPANLQGAINLTAGKLPCTGAFTINISDGQGNNEIKGNLALPKTSVSMQFDFTLDDSGNVGGSSIITEHGSTISMTGIHGGLAAEAISGDVVISPSGWTGIGNFSLATGNFSVSLTTPAGTAGAALNTNGGLDLTFADGTQETVTDPLVADPAGAIAGSGPSDAGSTDAGAFTSVALPSFAAFARSSDGRFGGSITGGAAANVPAYLAPGSSTPVALPLGGNVSGVVYAMNAKGAMVGYVSAKALPGFQDELPAYWASPTSQPVLLTILSGDVGGEGWGINAGGQIVVNGVEPIGNLEFHPVYYSSPTAAPVALSTVGLAVAANRTDGVATGINDSGLIIGGFSYELQDGSFQYDAYAWTSPSANPTKLLLPDGDTSAQVAAVNASGTMVGTTTPNFNSSQSFHAVIWSSPTAQPAVLTALGSDTLASPSDINSEGVVAGCSGTTIRSSRPPFIQWGPPGEAVVWSAAGHAVSQAGTCGDEPLVLITDSGELAIPSGQNNGSILLRPK